MSNCYRLMCCNSDSASTSSPSTYCFHVTRDIDLAGNMMDVLFDSTTIPSMRAAWDEKREVVGLLSPRRGVVLCFRSMRMSWYTKIDTIPIVQSCASRHLLSIPHQFWPPSTMWPGRAINRLPTTILWLVLEA